MRRWVLVLWLMSLGVACATATEYHVAKTGSDAVSCANADFAPDSTQAKLTIDAGLACLSTGDTLIIHEGTYVETMDLNTVPNGTISAPTTIRGMGTGPAFTTPPTTILKPATPIAGGGLAARVGNAREYLAIERLTIDMATLSPTAGENDALTIRDGSHHIVVDGIEIKNISDTNEDAFTVIDCATHSVTLRNSWLHALDDGVTANPNEAIYNQAPCLGVGSPNQYLNNVIENNLNNGISIRNGGGNPLQGAIIRNNIIRNNGGSCIDISGAPVTGGLYANNLCISNGAGITHLASSSGVEVYHNTVYATTGGGTTGACFRQGNPIAELSAGQKTTVTNNLCYLTTQESWIPSGNFVGNPTFESAGGGDFHLKSGSAARDTATCQASVTDDFDGRPRPVGGLCDHGAFEYAAPAVPPKHVDCDHSCSGNNGSSGNPYCSLQEWHDQALPVCGDIVLVHNGTCTGQFLPTRSCSNGLITIKAAPGEFPRFYNTSHATSTAVLNFINVEGWQVGEIGAGFDFNGSGVNTSQWVINDEIRNTATSSKQGVKIIGNTFRNWGTFDRVAVPSRNIINTLVSPSTTFTLNNLLIQGNTFDNNAVARHVMLMSTTNALVTENTITDWKCGYVVNNNGANIRAEMVGVKLQRNIGTSTAPSDTHDIGWNYIGPPGETSAQCRTALSSASPPYLENFFGWQGIYTDVVSYNLRAHNNLIVGIVTDHATSVANTENTAAIFNESRCIGARIYRNVLLGNSTGIRNSNNYASYNNGPAWPDYLYNNIIYSTQSQAYGISHRTHETYAKNNLVILTGSDVKNYRFTKDAAFPLPPHAAAFVNNNAYYAPNDATNFEYNDGSGGLVSGFAPWKTNCSCDGNSLSGSPDVINYSGNDFNASVGSSLIDAGTTITGVVINQAQQTGTILNQMTGSAPDIGIETVKAGTGGATLTATSLTIPFLNIHKNLSDGGGCTASRFTVSASAGGGRTGAGTGVTVAGNTVTLDVTGSAVAPLQPGETITVAGIYNACRSLFAGTGANVIEARSQPFTGLAIANTLAGVVVPSFAGCVVKNTATSQVEITLSNGGAALSPGSGGTGFTCRDDGSGKTLSGTASLVGNTYTQSFTTPFSALPAVLDCSYTPAGNIGNTAGELATFTNRVCDNQVAAPPAAPMGTGLVVLNTAPDEVILSTDDAGSAPMLPANDCTGLTVQDKTVVDCDRIGSTPQFLVKVTPGFAAGESKTGTYTTQGSGVATRLRNTAGTELEAFTLPIDNQVQNIAITYTVPHWRVAQPGAPIPTWIYAEDVLPPWSTIPAGTLQAGLIVRQAIYPSAAVETGFVWFGKQGAGAWFQLTNTCAVNPLCLAGDGVHAASDAGNTQMLTLNGRTFVQACSGYSVPNADPQTCILNGTSQQAEREAGIKVATGIAEGQTFSLKVCPDGSTDCSEVSQTIPLVLTVGPGLNARY